MADLSQGPFGDVPPPVSKQRKLIYFLVGFPIFLVIISVLGYGLIPSRYKFLEKRSASQKTSRVTQQTNPQLAAVNQIISLIQNPDPALVSKLDLDLVRLDEDQKRLIYGFFGKAGSETNYAPDSLYGLQALIREGKIEEAKKLLRKPLIISYLTNPVPSRDGQITNDRGGWNEQQLEKYDPRELLYSWRKWEIKDLGISRIKEKALITALKFYSGL